MLPALLPFLCCLFNGFLHSSSPYVLSNCLHKLVKHWHRRNQFFLHYMSCPLQLSNTGHDLKELLNHSLVYPLHPVCPKLIGVEEEDRGEGEEQGLGGEEEDVWRETIIVKKAREERKKRQWKQMGEMNEEKQKWQIIKKERGWNCSHPPFLGCKNQVSGEASDFQIQSISSFHSCLFLKSSCSLTYKFPFSLFNKGTTAHNIPLHMKLLGWDQ